MFTLIKTFDGFCCAFNYGALNEGSMEEFLKDDDFEYYMDPSDEDMATKGILVTSDSGRGSGLTVILDVEPDEYDYGSTLPGYGAKASRIYIYFNAA
ncbi:unnamed protein product, partial [Brenthis ino]